MFGGNFTLLLGIGLAAIGVYQMMRKSTTKLNRLNKGMTLSEVTAILEVPNQKEQKEDRTVYKYLLFAVGSGWKPVYVVFGPDDRLHEWFIDQKEYNREADRWQKAQELNIRQQELVERQRNSG